MRSVERVGRGWARWGCAWFLVALWGCDPAGSAGGQDAGLAQDAPQDAGLAQDVAPAPPPDPFEGAAQRKEGRLRDGDSVHKRLRAEGLSPRQIAEVVEGLGPEVDLALKARPGDRYKIALDGEGKVAAFEYQRAGQGEALRLVRGEAGLVLARVDGGAGAPDAGATPDAGGATPDAGGATPDAGGATPDAGGATPDAGGATPDAGGATPDAGGATPDAGGATSNAGGATPDAGGATSDAGGAPSAAQAGEQPLDVEMAGEKGEEMAAEAFDPLAPDPEELAKMEEEQKRLEEAEAQRRAQKNQVQEGPAVEPKDPVQKLIVQYYATGSEKERADIAKKLGSRLSIEQLRKQLVATYKPSKLGPGVYARTVRVSGGGSARYVIHVPSDYAPSKAMPMHISLHGGGGNGEGNCRVRWGPEQPKGVILVCPNTPGGHWWGPYGEKTILAVYRAVLREFNVQADKVSIGGASNGGNGTWHMASKYPWMWSAIVPRCSAALPKQEWLTNFLSVPAFLLHGSADHQIVVSHSRQMTEWLSALGKKPQYIEVKGAGHEFFTEHNPKVVKWLLPKKRSFPKKFKYIPTRGEAPEIIYWLSAEGSGTIEASMQDKGGTNVVEVKTQQNPRTLKVYFPKGMADLRRPVRVILNGKAVFQGKVRPDVRDTLDTFAATGDLRRVFDASVTVR